MELVSLCGHGSKILIADGNYPLKAKTGSAGRVYLGIKPGLPTVTDVLAALIDTVNFESYQIMVPDEGADPSIFQEFKAMLPELPSESLSRNDFYIACTDPSVELAISTGETRTFANILLTVGCA